MDTLDRYLTRQFLIYFLLILVSLTVLFFAVDFFTVFLRANFSLQKALITYLFKVPEVTQQLFPVATLMAVLLVLNMLSKSNEILALYVGGIGIVRIASTFVAGVALLSTAAFLFFDVMVPYAKNAKIRFDAGLPISGSLFHYPSRYWYHSDDAFVSVGGYDPKTGELSDISIYEVDDDFQIVNQIYSPRGTYDGSQWTLHDGFTVFEGTAFDYPISSRFARMEGAIDETPTYFQRYSYEAKALRLRDLRKTIRRNISHGVYSVKQITHYHERLALVFTPLIFTLIAIPFATRPLRRETMGRGLGACFLIVFLYLLIFRISITLGNHEYLPPAVAGWFANILFFLYAVLALVLKEGRLLRVKK